MTDPVTVTAADGMPYLAVDVQPDDVAGVFVLDVSQIGGPDVLALSKLDAGSWLNVVCGVTSVDYQRGAARIAGALVVTEAGTLTVVLEDTDGTFDPLTNRELIHTGSPVRVRAWSTDDGTGDPWEAVLFTGELDTLDVTYRREDPPLVTLAVVDIIGPLAAWESEGRAEPGVGSGDDLLGRVNRVLTEMARPGLVSPDSDAVFTATMAPTVLAQPWAEMQAATEAELGRLWVDASNLLVVRARGSELSGPVRGTLSDVHGEADPAPHCCMADARPRYGPDTMANRAMGARRLPGGDPGPATFVRLDDQLSQARYGVRSLDRRSLELATDAQVTAWAQAVILGHTLPDLRVDTVTPQPATDDLDSALAAWPAVCATDVGDRWAFRFRTGGRLVSETVGVLGITASLTPDGWQFVWLTGRAPEAGSTVAGGWLVVGASEVGGPDLIAPYAAPVPA